MISEDTTMKTIATMIQNSINNINAQIKLAESFGLVVESKVDYENPNLGLYNYVNKPNNFYVKVYKDLNK